MPTKNLHSLLTFVLIFLVSVSVSAVPSDDYFEQITLFSDGRITRFTRMPIRVYISVELKASAYLEALRYAMHQWAVASAGILRLEEYVVADTADIYVRPAHRDL